MGTSNIAYPKPPIHTLLNLHLLQGLTAQNTGCPPLTQGLRTPRLLPLPQITFAKHYELHLHTALQRTPYAWHSV